MIVRFFGEITIDNTGNPVSLTKTLFELIEAALPDGIFGIDKVYIWGVTLQNPSSFINVNEHVGSDSDDWTKQIFYQFSPNTLNNIKFLIIGA